VGNSREVSSPRSLESSTIETRPLDGVLLIDKPAGPTSHDVVARIRAVTGERRVGHTGTLDPLATGLLPLVLGRATRLSAHLTGGAKTYEATVRLGFGTDTDDAQGAPLGPAAARVPGDAAIDAALARFRGTFAQVPPSHSAKKIGGHRAYDLARQDAAPVLAPVTVTVTHLERTGREAGLLRLTVTATAGFYVRALARDLGRDLGCGAHLAALRRIRAGRFDVADALPLAEAERLGRDVAGRLIPPAEALADLAAVTVTPAGLQRTLHGNPLSPEHLAGRWVPPAGARADAPVRILDADGRLLALAHSRGGALHPAVVVG
jgi:tRNA pseudouridine55 synthase